ncbi:MAG: carboxypeptidase [Cyclobacteriaceae bacterium]|nr:carboxypeptidase [Cyclobacteriaceae bacterium]
MKNFNILFFVILLSITGYSQDRKLEADASVTTKGEVVIKGKRVPYTATTGTQPVWDESGKVIASLFHTYYERTDVTDRSTRPLVISFNGGPGSASVWMHIAYTGPKILKIDDEGYPVQPYGIKDNPNSILDVADIVYVNPVNTGYSRILDPEANRSIFFGVNEDIKYLAEWVNTFITRKNRWLSPKYLIGESYGTTRVSGLAKELQNSQWIFLNGVVLVSPTDLGIEREGPVSYALDLPYFTATAWYHKKLVPELQNKDLDEILPLSEEYAVNVLLPALAKGGFLPDGEKQKIAEKMSYYSGIDKKVFLQHNLSLPVSYFWKELLREDGFTVGRLDSRYTGIDKTDAGDRPDYNSELIAWEHSFAPAINYYIQNHLNYKTEIKYNLFGPVHPWNREGDTTGDDLRLAMAENPYLHVMIQSGFYDGATQYFNAKYTMWQLDPSGKLKDRLRFEGYRSGHMMYLRSEDLKTANDHLRDFIKKSTFTNGTPAKYR